MAVLTRQQVDDAKDLVTKTVPVPEWGGDVVLRSAASADLVAYEHSLVATRVVDGKPEIVSDYRNEEARLVVRCLVDAAGVRLYSDDEADALGKKNSAVIKRLFNIVRAMSGMAGGAVADAAKNSVAAPPAALHSF